ncbi:MAG: DUF433 domain-containing protein [Chloroflexota bacterium]|nr:DUF433 domain-containing protein [Chloroflexota bacterium]
MPPVDAAEVPVYSLSEAAKYARTSPQSVARWRAGYTFETSRGRHRSGPVTGGFGAGLLTFNDLIETAIIAAARRERIPMQAIRRAITTAKDLYGVDRPLSVIRFKHDGHELWTRELEKYVNLSRTGQIAWEHIADVLHDLVYEQGVAVRWFPRGRDEPVVIDPRVSFGRPYIIRKGISTDVVRSRFLANEALPSIAEDLGLSDNEVEAALRFEYPQAA